jgi:hypothetical protein
MFESLNFFKTIPCPYYLSTTNPNQKCDRPYCQFRHSIPQKEVEPQQQQQQQQSTPTTTTTILDESDEQLPTALEHLSNALQSVQKLLIKNDSKVNQLEEKTSLATATVSTTPDLINKLAIISNAISNTKSKTKDEQIKPSQKLTETLKRQQEAAPDYNPTPIKQLKSNQSSINDNQQQQSPTPDNTTNTTTKRKLVTEKDNFKEDDSSKR